VQTVNPCWPRQPDSPQPEEAILFCWSGGKDSAMALYALARHKARVTGLLTTVTDDYDRVSMHGVRRSLLVKQARALGLPLAEVRIPPQCVNPVYESRMEQALRAQIACGVSAVAFGDIFLADLREYRERNLARLKLKALFPIWKRDTRELAFEFCSLGFRAVAVAIDPQKLDRSFAGRELTPGFFADLPSNVDPCGENGEFHTFVFAGPIFEQTIEFRRGETVDREGFTFCDLTALEDRL
jgi:uncharacterized protein (TIGR00290 family)